MASGYINVKIWNADEGTMITEERLYNRKDFTMMLIDYFAEDMFFLHKLRNSIGHCPVTLSDFLSDVYEDMLFEASEDGYKKALIMDDMPVSPLKIEVRFCREEKTSE